ncbi:MAG: DUF2298 domain-containing protein [Anaerolineaceae bacterium]
MPSEIADKPLSHTNSGWRRIVTLIALVVIMVGGVALRTYNIDWDQGKHLHPDERFLSDVLSRISPVQPGVSYFDTAQSDLNPGNKGIDFFVYGTAPIFLVRYLGEFFEQTGYDRITYLGRTLSALADSLTILLVFLIGKRLYNDKVGLVAAALYACAVLPIQQSHFMTVDTFTNTFGMLTVYSGVLIARLRWQDRATTESKSLSWRWIWPYLLFGVGLGLATASKINAVSLALLLPVIELIRTYKSKDADRNALLVMGVSFSLLAAVTSFLVFRIAQPYAFSGPGFFNFAINPKWLTAMQSLLAQSSGNVDFPPALQWARRSWFFSVSNLAQWGIGLPFAIAALLGIVLMGRAIIKHKQLEHLPIWFWTLFYFLWQSTSWVKAMRYFLLIYPLLALLAAWGIVRLVERLSDFQFRQIRISRKLLKGFGIGLGISAIVGTAAWAYAFTRVYSQNHTRVEASEWIYENIPAPINLLGVSEGKEVVTLVPVRIFDQMEPGQVYSIPFTSDYDGSLQSLTLPKVWTNDPATSVVDLSLEVYEDGRQISETVMAQYLLPSDGSQVASVTFNFERAVRINSNQPYLITLTSNGTDQIAYLRESPQIQIVREDGVVVSKVLNKFVETIRPNKPITLQYSIEKPQEVHSLSLPFVLDLSQTPGSKTLKATLISSSGTTSGQVVADFQSLGDDRGESVQIELEQPLIVSQAESISIQLELVKGDAQLAIYQYAPAHESTWDDALPLILPGLSAYNYDSGLYRDDLNLELYWPDDYSKQQRILDTLERADYVFITSNRQWGTTTRVPERYPLTSAYYRGLMGCPDQMDLVTCYNDAEPGQYAGKFGFELVKTQTAYPQIFGISFNDQYAEEAFSVYDHPKVLIFRKTDAYQRATVEDYLNQVDLNKVVYLTPKQADSYEADTLTDQNLLELSPERQAIEREGGTWSELFDRQSQLNQNPVLSVVVFYLFSSLLGLIAFPIVFIGMPGLKDRGYAFARLAGFMLFGYCAFILGSSGVAVTRLLLVKVLIGLGVLSLLTYVIKRRQIGEFLKENWRKLLVIEVIALVSFLFFLWVRVQNPDLWHPSKGGEKPMDFSFLNAIIKSTNFPPYDPWYAGGYINYYYYGMLLVAMPIKLLGIIPASAYNIILPIWYSLLIIGAYSIGYNIYHALGQNRVSSGNKQNRIGLWSTISGVITALLLGFLGNLGEVKLLSEVFRGLGAGTQFNPDASFVQQAIWFVKGIGQYLKKVPYPMDPGAWYWNPSRAIPGDVITEFPYFTFIYADLHAHLLAMPIVIFAVGWGLSVLLSKGKWAERKAENLVGMGIGLLLGGLIIGAIKSANTWDFYTFLILNVSILAYVGFKYWLPVKHNLKKLNPGLTRALQVVAVIAILVALSYMLYQPFNENFHPAFNSVGFWSGDHTPIKSYLMHWGLMLFIIVVWLAWETYQWMARTPISFIKSLTPYKKTILLIGSFFGLALLLLLLLKVQIAIIAVPLCVWSLLLLLIPEQPDAKRFIFFALSTALLLTLMVEVVFLEGEIGRMNTVFKFYIQAWLLFTMVTGAALVTLLRDLPKWRLRSQLLFQVPLVLLVASALLFPMLGTISKINDRIVPEAPTGLDGMAFMNQAWNYDMGKMMDLSQDYRAILWLQDNVEGSPVILEGFRGYEYRWNNRMTIYTGLPDVVGWNYHQRQQRGILSNNAVQERVDEVDAFYMSRDLQFMRNFLEKYQVEYIIVGQVEQAFYPEADFSKFRQLEGIFWDVAYQDQDTTIYQVRSR